MGTVGLAMIVKNEPVDRIAMLVEYLRPVVTQFVIADTGSDQSDVELYKEWGVDAYDHEWKNDFSEARNSTLERLETDWVLHLDGDELPSTAMMQHLTWIKDESPKQYDGYRVWTRNFWGGVRGTEADYHWHCRMFRRAKGRWYKPVHEQVMLDGKKEHQAIAAGTLIKAHKDAYLIHSKPAERLNRAAEQYSALGEGEAQ